MRRGLVAVLILLATRPMYAYVVAFSVGPAWYHTVQTQTVYLQPFFPNTYIADQTTKALADGELFLGIQKPLHKDLLGQFGVTLAGTTPVEFKGEVWEMGDPTFDNFVYDYRLKHMHVAVKGKLFATPFSETTWPYISGSVGVGFNRSYDYDTSAVIPEAVAPPNFENNTKTAFTYTLGAGIQRVFNSNLQAGIGYAFANWGQSALSPALGQQTQGVLALNSFYTNQLQFNITYVG